MYDEGGAGGLEYGMYHSSSSCDLRVDLGRSRMNGSAKFILSEERDSSDRCEAWKELDEVDSCL